MSALHLQLWLLCELACYTFLGRWLFDLTPGRALMAAALCLLLLRLVQSLATWVIAANLAGPERMRPSLRQIVREAAASLFMQLLVLPLPSLWMPPDRIAAGRPILLLVHGYTCNRAVWWYLRRRLEAAGFAVASITLGPPFVSLGRMAPQLEQRIAELRQTHRNAPLILIGHSMGGLVCRSWLARYGSRDSHGVSRLITLASPNGGTELARFSHSPNGREMRTGSQWLQDLAHDRPPMPVLALENPLDNFAFPVAQQRLDGAHNLRTPPVGHITMLYDRRIADLLIDLCRPNSPNLP